MINEYGALDQEAPAGILWQISQLERNEGTRTASGPWNIVVNNMEALGFASDRNAYLLLHCIYGGRLGGRSRPYHLFIYQRQSEYHNSPGGS